MGLITLITDFGTVDGYVGEMKGEILTRLPGAAAIDVTHDVEPGDIDGAAWTLDRIWARFPAGTVHLVVVDPGVGGQRRPLAAAASGRWFVGPDNGVLSRVEQRHGLEEARVLEPARFTKRVPSSTFHGRDVFAPAAAWLAAGKPPEELGPAVPASSVVRRVGGGAERVGASARGRIVHIDRFGNLLTDIPAGWLGPTALIEVGGQVISGVKASYVSVPSGRLVALIGSGGTLEISVRDGSAAKRLAVKRGQVVSIRPERD